MNTEKKYTEEDLLKLAEMIDNSYRSFTSENTIASEIIENFIENGFEDEIEEETVLVTYSMIRQTVGWSEFCDVTGKNHYAINEWGHYDDGHTFEITKAEYNTLF